MVVTRLRSALMVLVSICVSLVATVSAPVPAAASSVWLDRFNLWRAASNLPPVTENTTWSQGDYNHSLYMVKNDQVTHYELSSLPYYTVAGDTAARNGNIQVSSMTSTTDDHAIDWWMGAPFHELGMMDPRLTSTGFGSYREVKSGWQAGFTLDTLRGNSFSGGTYPVYFPGNGSAVPLTTYSGNEFPDPLQGCPGYSAPVGLPVTIQVGGNVATSVTAHSFTGNGVPLAHCVIDSTNAAVGSNLVSRGAVIVIPQQPLTQGVTYTVALTVNGAPYTWSFGISSANAIVAGACNASITGWSSLGAVATSAPGASTWGCGRSDVFVRGSDNGVWQNTTLGGSWGAWTSLGGVITSRPAAVSWGPSRIDMFARGQDNGLWHRWWSGSAWSGWYPMGGALGGGAGVAAWSAGRLDVFATGQDKALWHRAWNGQSWEPWQSLGGGLTSDPAAVSWGPNRIDIFAKGQDNALWHLAWNGTSWIPWQSLGGTLASGPAVASCSAGHLDVFALGAGSSVFHVGFNGSAWSAWAGLGTLQWTSDPAAICQPGSSVVQLFERAADNSINETTAPAS